MCIPFCSQLYKSDPEWVKTREEYLNPPVLDSTSKLLYTLGKIQKLYEIELNYCNDE